MAKSKSPPETIADARSRLAEAEYLNRYLVTCDLAQAELAYQKAVGKLDAKIPDDVERKAIVLRRQMLDILDPRIRSVKREENKEYEMLHAQVRRLVLKDDIAETGIPDKIEPAHLKDMGAEELTYAINAISKLQEMRRNILIS